MAQSPDPKQKNSTPNPMAKKDDKNKTFGNEPEVNDPQLPEQPDKIEVNNPQSTPRREDMH